MIKERTKFPLILKISYLNDYRDRLFWKKIEGLVSAISINAVPWSMVYGDKKSPFEKYGYGPGAVSGKTAQTHTWALHKYLTEITKIPVILPSISETDDLIEAFNKRKAPAVSMCALLLQNSSEAMAIIERCLKKII